MSLLPVCTRREFQMLCHWEFVIPELPLLSLSLAWNADRFQVPLRRRFLTSDVVALLLWIHLSLWMELLIPERVHILPFPAPLHVVDNGIQLTSRLSLLPLPKRHFSFFLPLVCVLTHRGICFLSKIDLGVIAHESMSFTRRLPRVHKATSETRCIVILAMNLSPTFLGECIPLSMSARDVLDLVIEVVVLSCIFTREYWIRLIPNPAIRLLSDTATKCMWERVSFRWRIEIRFWRHLLEICDSLCLSRLSRLIRRWMVVRRLTVLWLIQTHF